MQLCDIFVYGQLLDHIGISEPFWKINRIDIFVHSVVINEFYVKIHIFDYDIFLFKIIGKKIFGFFSMDKLDF